VKSKQILKWEQDKSPPHKSLPDIRSRTKVTQTKAPWQKAYNEIIIQSYYTEDERNNKLEEQKKNNVYHNLVEEHLIIKQGLVDKRKVGIYLIGLVINMS
jgi:hypothetical protein